MKSESNAHCLLTEIHSWLSAKGHCQSITFVQTRLRKHGEQETLKPVFNPGETSKWQEREIKSQRGSKVTGGYTTGIIWTAVKTNSLRCDGLHLKVLSLPFFFLKSLFKFSLLFYFSSSRQIILTPIWNSEAHAWWKREDSGPHWYVTAAPTKPLLPFSLLF